MEAQLVGAIGRVAGRVCDQGAVGWADRADRNGQARLELRDHVESVRFGITDLMRESPPPAAANYGTQVRALRSVNAGSGADRIDRLIGASDPRSAGQAIRIQTIFYDDASQIDRQSRF
jgi:hypothetical protein